MSSLENVIKSNVIAGMFNSKDPAYKTSFERFKARSDGLRKTQWDREFSNSLRFSHA